MKSQIIYFILFLLIVASTPTLAQKPINKPRKTQQSLPKAEPTLNNPSQPPPKTTEQTPRLEQLPKAQPTIPPLQPFNQNATTLPTNYTGHSVKLIAEVLLKRRKEMKRDEFETTEQFQQRLALLKSTAIAPGVLPDSLFTFVIKLPATYDADNETIQLVKQFNGPRSMSNALKTYRDAEGQVINQDYASLNVSSSLLKREKYTANNAYGATVEVIREYTLDNNLAILNWSALPGLENPGNLESPQIKLRFRLSTDKARQSKDSLRLLIISRLAEPLVGDSFSSVEPTFKSPMEYHTLTNALFVKAVSLWVFDLQTGEIFARLDALNDENASRKLIAATIEPSLQALQSLIDIGGKGLLEFGKNYRAIRSKDKNSYQNISNKEIREEIMKAWSDFGFAYNNLAESTRAIYTYDNDYDYGALTTRYGFPRHKKQNQLVDKEQAFSYVYRSAENHLRRAQQLYAQLK